MSSLLHTAGLASGSSGEGGAAAVAGRPLVVAVVAAWSISCVGS